jgi:signal transduction histidine kinase
VRREADTLGRIARNLRELAQTEDQRHPLDREPAAPRDLAVDAIEEAALSAERAGVKLVLDVDPALPSVLADRKRLGVALAALLQNAIAHSSAGGEVTVRAAAEDGGVRFAVIDGGSGIPAERLSHVFEPFYQVPGTEDLGGVGLGLTIARDIVRAHGGEIDVESTEGRGSTFRFLLPAAPEWL